MINLPVVGRFGQTRVRIERSGRGGWARHKDLQEAQSVRPNPRGFLVRFSFFQASVEGSHHRVPLRLLHFCTHSTQPAQQITPWTIHANARTREMANACVGQRKAMGESPLCSLSLVCGMYARRRASRNGPDSLARHCSRNASADACNFL